MLICSQLENLHSAIYVYNLLSSNPPHTHTTCNTHPHSCPLPPAPTCTHAPTHTHAHTTLSNTHTQTRTPHTQTHSHKHATHSQTHTHTLTHTHTHSHTHTHTPTQITPGLGVIAALLVLFVVREPPRGHVDGQRSKSSKGVRGKSGAVAYLQDVWYCLTK